MRFFPRIAAVATLVLAVASCSDVGPTSPLRGGAPLLAAGEDGRALVWVSEFHYDNTGTDTGEAVEIMGPAGTSLEGWQLVLYNGNGGSVYRTDALAGTIPDQCNGYGVVVVDYPSNGIQNGAPDGVALADAAGDVYDAFAYEGSMTAVGGPADGWTLADIGVSQGGSEAVGASLQRDGAGAFQRTGSNSFGACNGGAPMAPTPPDIGPDPGDEGLITPTGSLLSEIRVDQQGADNDEYFELSGAAGTSLDGLTYLVLGDTGDGATESSGDVEAVVSLDGHSIPDSGYFVAAEASFTLGTPDLVANLNFENGDNVTHLVVRGFTGASGDDLDADDDGVLDSLPWTEVVDCLSLVLADAAAQNRLYCAVQIGPDGSFAPGHVYRDGATWRIGGFEAGEDDSPGGAPGTGNGGGGGSLTIVGRSPGGDPPLPVGFQDQIFVQGGTAPVTWTSSAPDVASIDANGVITAHAPGSVTFTATSGTTTGSVTLEMAVATASGIAYSGNTEFGVPSDGDPAGDLLITYEQFTSSFNVARGTPNWVSYNLDAEHFGDFDRCDCFTLDPAVGDALQLDTNDYTGSGYSRGHLVRSADRDAGSLDNARTYYFSNIVPQHADNNEGPWSELEMYLGSQAGSREVYIIAGPHGSQGTLKGEGKVVIPGAVWKVAVLMDPEEGLDDVDSAADVEVIAVLMPNVPGIRSTPWQQYAVTVDQVESVTGYDLLALLPDHVEAAVERGGNAAPVADIAGPKAATEGAAITLSAAGSTDADGDELSFRWTLPSGQTSAGAELAVTFAQDGSYEVTLVATDALGAADTAAVTVTVANVAPQVAELPDALLLPGETYSTEGAFADPGADAWTATVDYGDGSGPRPLELDGREFALEHHYAAPGSYTVTVTVRDDDDAGSATATVEVMTHLQGVRQLGTLLVQTLIDTGRVDKGMAKLMQAKVDVMIKQMEKGHVNPTVNQMRVIAQSLEALIQSGGATAEEVQPLTDLIDRLLRSLST